MKKKLVIIGFIAVLGLVSTPYAIALTYTSTNLDEGPGAGITYTLNISGTNAAFTVATSSDTSPEWYAGWFIFKFDGGNAVSITSLTLPSSTGPWEIADYDTNKSVKVLAGGGNYHSLIFPPNNRYGFFVDSLAQDGAADNITQGILLTGGTSTYYFSFNVDVIDGSVNIDEIPFQVGFYSYKQDGTIAVNQLSRTLAVPEPATLLLLGSGLIGLGILGRKRFKGRS